MTVKIVYATTYVIRGLSLALFIFNLLISVYASKIKEFTIVSAPAQTKTNITV